MDARAQFEVVKARFLSGRGPVSREALNELLTMRNSLVAYRDSLGEAERALLVDIQAFIAQLQLAA